MGRLNIYWIQLVLTIPFTLFWIFVQKKGKTFSCLPVLFKCFSLFPLDFFLVTVVPGWQVEDSQFAFLFHRCFHHLVGNLWSWLCVPGLFWCWFIPVIIQEHTEILPISQQGVASGPGVISPLVQKAYGTIRGVIISSHFISLFYAANLII